MIRLHTIFREMFLHCIIGCFSYCSYRLLAVDHDLFSFTDSRLNQWPLVLVTNPKDSQFSVPGREPLGRMAHSTHVR